jgi:uncharacterized protein YjbI with pentapeptide repeats
LKAQTCATLTSTGAIFSWQIYPELILKAQLQGADLKEANLTDANLRYANLGRDNVGGSTQLQGARLEGANLEGTILEGAEYDTNTVFPKRFDPKKRKMVLKSSPLENRR